MRAKLFSALRVVGAVATCSGLAALASLFVRDEDFGFRSKLPLVFLVLIVLIAKKVGEAAAILSTVAAALVFAFLLFQPLGSFGVASKEARSSLAWFLLGGMVCAHLLSPAKSRSAGSSEFSRDTSEE
jgi:K+-sensing histidine kinase KdpD